MWRACVTGLRVETWKTSRTCLVGVEMLVSGRWALDSVCLHSSSTVPWGQEGMPCAPAHMYLLHECHAHMQTLCIGVLAG